MSLYVAAGEMPVKKSTRSGPSIGTMITRKAYGNEGSLMVALRYPGYHTYPHIHDCEQINYIIEGVIWFFVEEKGYLCKPGDFQRIPRNAIHWAWNRSEKPTTVIEAHAPPLIGDTAGEGAVALFDEKEKPQLKGVPNVSRIEYNHEKVEKSFEKEGLLKGLYISGKNLPLRRRQLEKGSGTLAMQKVFGNECSLMIAERNPGYHTPPHIHDCEQINYIMQGEIWFFVTEKGFPCKQGDFQRIPRNAIHWAWNHSEKPATVAEIHIPPMVNSLSEEGALFDFSESPRLVGMARNAFIDYDGNKTESKMGLF